MNGKQNTNVEQEKNEELSTPELISLMEVYLCEMNHRDDLIWKQTFVFFYAILIVILLPNIASFLKITLPSLPDVLFPIIGIILDFVFLYITLGSTKRHEAIGKTYSNLIDMLPKKYRRIKVKSLNHGKLFNFRLAHVIPFLMFMALFVLSGTIVFKHYF